MDKGRTVNIVYLYFSKTFNTFSHDIYRGKLRKCGLYEWTETWIENKLNGRSQRVLISCVGSSWRFLTNGVPQGLILDLNEGTDDSLDSLGVVTLHWGACSSTKPPYASRNTF
ncbi:rna-directed dna polymerase from mobile element jockey-like [Pitangus sulphuratus]|nr:rna-directed dna polymerase from mobile element jockey-like [Pitangus sulphuratus]